MRAKEFLLEYNRGKTAEQVGNRVIMALANDRSTDLPHFLDSLRRKLQGIAKMDPSKIDAVIPPAQQADNINAILAEIEKKDPTPNKAYTPWLAKMYAKAGGGLMIEDMNRMDLLRLFDLAKKRRKIKPEHADINRFKWYVDFEDTMEAEYNYFQDLEADSQPEGEATKVYQDESVMVIVPHDQAASCKYGRGTRWCTAATTGTNYFDNYNRQGKLYIVIPKQPQYDGEKYQLHFQSGQFMDPSDDPVPLGDVLERFPGFTEYLKQNEPAVQDIIMFAPDEVLQPILEKINEYAQEKVWDVLTDWETSDSYYYSEMRDRYGDEDGDIDWDRAAEDNMDYLNWNDEARRWVNKIESVLNPSPEEVREWSQDEDLNDYGELTSIEKLEMILANKIEETFGRREGDGGIAEFLKRRVVISKKQSEDGTPTYTVSISKNS